MSGNVPGSDSSTADAGTQDQDHSPGAGYISTLLIDNEIPLIGGKWHGDIFVDAPMNGEPDSAGLTLRRAKLMYSRGFGNE